MRNYTVFVSSADSYSDLWDIFFDLFHKYWPEFEGKIVLNTQEKSYTYPGLDIKCTNVGHLNGFGRTLRAGLDQVETDYVLFFLIDFIFMGRVNNDKLQDCFEYFVENSLDALYLTHHNSPMLCCHDNKDISKLLPSPFFFSYQVSFWNKTILKEMALPHENPWSSEWYGNKRAVAAALDFRAINDKINNVFIYNNSGCVHLGKWLPEAVEFLNKEGYQIDFCKRGYYLNEYQTFKVRLKLRLTFILHGLMGSYWRKITV